MSAQIPQEQSQGESVPTTSQNISLDTVGFGYMSNAIHGASAQHLWDVMKQEIKAVASYFPVEHVRYEEKVGFVQRSMTYVGSSPSKLETKIVQKVYCDEVNREIKFVRIDDAGFETNEELVQALVMMDQLTPRIEYYMRDRVTQKRIPCDMPTSEAISAIERTADVARVVQRAFGR